MVIIISISLFNMRMQVFDAAVGAYMTWHSFFLILQELVLENLIQKHCTKVKVKFCMAWSPSNENILPLFVVTVINYTVSNAISNYTVSNAIRNYTVSNATLNQPNVQFLVAVDCNQEYIAMTSNCSSSMNIRSIAWNNVIML